MINSAASKYDDGPNNARKQNNANIQNRQQAKKRFAAKLMNMGDKSELNQMKNELLTGIKSKEKKKITSLYGYNYNYSDESQDEKKYITRRNKRFYSMSTRR